MNTLSISSGIRMAAIAAAAAASFAAHAGLVGSNVTSQYYSYGGIYNGYGSPASFIADGSSQQSFCAACLQGFSLAVTDTQVIYTLLGDSAWSGSSTSLNSGGLLIDNGNLLSFLGVTIDSVSLDAASNLAGFGAGNVTFNSGAIAISWQSLGTGGRGQQVILNVNSSGGNVPEPGTYALASLALLGLAAARRRKA